MISRFRRMLAAMLLAAFMCLQASCGSPVARSPAPSAPADASVQPSNISDSPTSCPSDANPSASPAATQNASGPKATANTGEFRLCLFGPYFSQEEHNEIIRIQTALNENGWRVSFLLETYGEEIDYSQESAVIHNLIAKHAASGDALADGFIVQADMAETLVEEDIAQDVSGTLKQAAPSLYARFQGYFEKSTVGIPVRMSCGSGSGSPALILKEEYASRLKFQINGIDDLLKLDGALDNERLIIYPQILYDIWANQQGYYSLSGYGFQGLLYAAYADEACMPVPLESIPGFRDFMKKFYRLYKSVGYDGAPDVPQTQIAGYTYVLNKSLVYLAPEVPRRYVAYPLGLAPQVLPDDAPRVHEEIAVSATSSKAADIARCMEWLFTSQENYDTVQYGKQGRDYRITDNRLEMLSDGYPVAFDSERYFKYIYVFYFDSLERLTVHAPVNFDEAVASCRHRSQPMENIGTQSGITEKMQVFAESKPELFSKRYEILLNFDQQEMLNTIKSEDEFVSIICKRLDNTREDTKMLVNEYAKLIQQMR